MMESAIDRHLQCPRTRTRRIADDYQPPFPAFAARAPIAMTQVVMGYFGVQYRDANDPHAVEAFAAVKKLFSAPNGPKHTDFANGAHYHTFLAIAYWTTPAEYDLWQASASVADWWKSDQRLNDGVGYFREILKPKMEQFEPLAPLARLKALASSWAP